MLRSKTLVRSLLTPLAQIQRQKATVTADVDVKPSSAIPGPTSYPIVGTIPYLIQNGGRFQNDKLTLALHKDFGPISRVEPMKIKMYFVNHPDDIESLYRQRGRIPFPPAAFLPSFSRYFKDKSEDTLGTAVTEKWRTLRTAFQKDLLPPQAAEGYLPIFAEATEKVSKLLPQYAGNVGEIIPRFTFEVMGRILFDVSLGALSPNPDPRDLKFVQSAMNAFELMNVLTAQPPFLRKYETPNWKKFKECMDYILTRGAEHIRDEIARINRGEQRNSYVAKLLEQGISEDVLAHNVAQFLFAGVDTTANTLLWNFTHLAWNPEVQDKLYHEFKTNLKGKSVMPGDSSNLPYMKAFFKESFRMDATATGTIMKFNDDIIVRGYKIEKGSIVRPSALPYQKDPTIFEDANKLIPERWFPEAVEKRKKEGNTLPDHSFMITPFSFGPRICIGFRVASNEAHQFWSRVLQDYRIELLPGQTYPERASKGLLYPKPVPKVKFVPRN